MGNVITSVLISERGGQESPRLTMEAEIGETWSQAKDQELSL